MDSFFHDDREVDVLVRSLARKLLRENKTDLPPAILANITGVSEDLWVKTYSQRRCFLNDIYTPMVLDAIEELDKLDQEERNFLDKLYHLLLIIYKINFKYPELVILFHSLESSDEKEESIKIKEAMEDLFQKAQWMLLNQAHIEDIVNNNSPMEKVLKFIIHQMLLSCQSQLSDFCDEYVKNGKAAVFPDKNEWVEKLMKPIVEQLEGITAI
jgi:hypothetical protein